MKIIRLLTLALLLFPGLALAQKNEVKKSLHHPPATKDKPALNAPKSRLRIPLSARLQIPLELPVPAPLRPTPTPTPKVLANDGAEPIQSEGFVTLPAPQQMALEGEPQSGNVVLNVTENGNKSVKLGLAPRGVAVIDFPADDPVYKIYPGDENFVTVDCLARQDGKCANSPTDAIVLRPGKSFHALGTEESAATVVSIQRQSGIVVSFIVVPVPNIAQNANYVVVRYDLKQVLEARQKAGLAFNLQTGVKASPVTLPTPVESRPGAQIINASLAAGSVALAGSQPDSEQSASQSQNDLTQKVMAALNNAARRTDLRFAKPAQGISLAPALLGERTGDITIDVVAVRNVLPQAIRLVSEQPELVVENRDKGEASVNLQRLGILHTATTVEADDVLLPGQVYYFAFAYTSPILGVKQVLRVSFSHRSAADAPATLDLGISTR